MKYLIVTHSNGEYFLLMTDPDNELDGKSCIQGFESKEEVMDSFKPYTKGWTSSYERSTSCAIGMMNMRPIAIEAPIIGEKLIPHIKEMKLFKIAGGVLGRGYHGIPVHESILELKQFDIWDESMKLAGIK